jgi:hypothetical protein
VVACHLGVSTQSVLRGLDAADRLLKEQGLKLVDLLPCGVSVRTSGQG